MKKLFAIIGLCCSLVLCSCQSTTPTSTTNVSASPVVTASNATATATPTTTPQATATPNTSSSQTIASYYPFNSNKKYTYDGSGNEYAAYTVYTDYTTATRVQFRVDNGGTVAAKVMEISNGELKVLVNKGEFYYRENLTTTKVTTGDVLLKEPLVKGTTWTLSDGTKRYISNVAVSVTTPAGTFNTIEVTTEHKDGNKSLDYYAQKIGLVKSVYKASDLEVSSTLSKIESNVKLTQTIKFYYPNINNDKIYYVSKQLSFSTNDITRTMIETAYKTVPANLGVGNVLSTNTKIKSLYLNSNGALYVDFSKELISEMNAGSGYESMILQSITNTLGEYYGVEKVYLTVEGNPYSSGHIYMKKGEFFKVNLTNTVSGD